GRRPTAGERDQRVERGGGRGRGAIWCQTQRCNGIDDPMEACSKQDHDCRFAVIGPFLVEQVSQTPDAVRYSRFIAALALAAPKRTAAEREDAVQKYQAAKEHRALAVVPEISRHFRSTEWPSAEAAEEGVLERCQVLHGRPCTVLAVDDVLRPTPRDGKWPM